MGKKVSPHAIRIGITRSWDSTWFARFGKNFSANILQDNNIRKYLKKKYEEASVSKITIERGRDKAVTVEIHTAKPGLIIGRSGEAIKQLRQELRQKFGVNIEITISEVAKPDADAQILANDIAQKIEKRFPYRRVCKMAVDKAKEIGVKGIKIRVGGRLNGVDIARSESYSHGTVPLHTLRANIDYATAQAKTTYGIIGVKVWVYHGLVFKDKKQLF